MQISRDQRNSTIYDLDTGRLRWVYALGEPEPVSDRATGERVQVEGVPLWAITVGVPGVRVSGMTGVAELALSFTGHTAPSIGVMDRVSLQGLTTLRGMVVGAGRDRVARLSLRASAVTSYTGDQDNPVSDVDGLPIVLRSDGQLRVLAAQEPRNQWDGTPITDRGRGIVRVQTLASTVFERSDGTGSFRKNELVFVDVPATQWAGAGLGPTSPVNFVDLRCDARLTPAGGLVMALAAAGAVRPPDPVVPVPARGRKVEEAAAAESSE